MLSLRVVCAGERGWLCTSWVVKGAALLTQQSAATEGKGETGSWGEEEAACAAREVAPGAGAGCGSIAQSPGFSCAEEGPGRRLEGVEDHGGWEGTPKLSRGSQGCGHPHRQLVLLENQQPGNRSLRTLRPTVQGAPRAEISSSGNEESGLDRVWEGKGGARYPKARDTGTEDESGSWWYGGASLAQSLQ